MPVTWHARKWCDWCMLEDEKKRNKTNIVSLKINLLINFL